MKKRMKVDQKEADQMIQGEEVRVKRVDLEGSETQVKMMMRVRRVGNKGNDVMRVKINL